LSKDELIVVIEISFEQANGLHLVDVVVAGSLFQEDGEANPPTREGDTSIGVGADG
jgi:hypothetical protein